MSSGKSGLNLNCFKKSVPLPGTPFQSLKQVRLAPWAKVSRCALLQHQAQMYKNVQEWGEGLGVVPSRVPGLRTYGGSKSGGSKGGGDRWMGQGCGQPAMLIEK